MSISAPAANKRVADEVADAEEIVAGKKTRFDAPPRAMRTLSCYRDVDVNAWTTKIRGKNKHGSPLIMIFGEDGVPTFALSHKDEPRGVFPFKLDLDPINGAQIPSFLSGKADLNKVTESLDFQITLTPEQANFANKIDAWAKQQGLNNSKEWFNRQFSEADIATMYIPVLKKDKEEKYEPKIKGKFVLSGVKDLQTKVTFIGADKSKVVGAGWDFVKPLLGSDNWRGNEVRAVVDCRRIWVVGKKFGVIVQFKHLIVVEKKKKVMDVDFPELDELDLS